MLKILIVDDSELMRALLREVLSKFNVEIFEASNGEEGVNSYKKNNPDLVILDITMPLMNGVDALEEIIKYDADAKVIMLSAIGQRSVVIKCIKKGAKAYIVKPFEENEVVQTVQKILPLS